MIFYRGLHQTGRRIFDVGAILICIFLISIAYQVSASGRSAYIMSSGNSEQDQAVLDALFEYGHYPTLGVQMWEWDGSQADLDIYDTVVILATDSYRVADMPPEGQLALVDFVENGGGLITGEWFVWSVDIDKFHQILAPLMPSNLANYYYVPSTTLFEVDTDPIINEGVSESFDLTMASNDGGSESVLYPKPGAKVFYWSTQVGAAAVIGWDYCEGRVINFSTLISQVELSYPDYKRLFSNSVNWSANSTVTNCIADLSVAIDSDSNAGYVGVPLVYTTTVTNNGPGVATNVVVRNMLPGFTLTTGQTVYLMSSGNSEQDQAVVATLVEYGHIPTLGVEFWQWDGSQADLNIYDAVLILAAENYNVAEMPITGQLALTDYVANGGGLITGEWFVWSVDIEMRHQTLAPLMPSRANNFWVGNAVNVYATAFDPVLGYLLPDSYDFSLGYSFGGSESTLLPKPGATTFYRSALALGGSVIGWDYLDGRVINFSTLISPIELSSLEYKRMLVNAISWSAQENLQSLDVSLVSTSSPQALCSGDDGHVGCKLTALSPGASFSIETMVIPIHTGQLTNNVHVSAFEQDDGETNNSATMILDVNNGLDIEFYVEDTTTSLEIGTVTFTEVTNWGEVFLTSSNDGLTSPSGFNLGDPPVYYDISTSVEYLGSVEVCINYSGTSFINESSVRLFHYENDTWIDITTSLDIEANIVCGNVTTFSPFGVFEAENSPPTADAGGPYDVAEGSRIDLDQAVANDPNGDTVVSVWTISSPFCSFDDASLLNPELTCTDNGYFTATLTVTDGINAYVSDSAIVQVQNVSPTIDYLAVPTTPVNLNDLEAYSVDVSYSDPAGVLDEPYTCDFDMDMDNSVDYSISVTGTTCSVPLNYTEPGVYSINVTVMDKDGGAVSQTGEAFVVVYDPAGGFVTGAGWITSPAGAFSADPTQSGKANFGFVSKYKKGASVPTGNTEFNFNAGGMSFHSENYLWLVVNQGGTNAQFKGTGTINGDLAPNSQEYNFVIWATDGSPDTFRIKIWWEDNGGNEIVVYDNGFGQPLGGGEIKVHDGN